MKTINFELSKRLNDLWLLDNIETEFYYSSEITDIDIIRKKLNIGYWRLLNTDIPALTLEEAIEFLKNKIQKRNEFNDFRISILWYEYECYFIYYDFVWEWKTLLEALELLIELLLDNNLLTK